LTTNRYLFDTHSLIFWSSKELVSDDFIRFFDGQAGAGNVFVSSICFWETALLAKKGKIAVQNVHEWKTGLLENGRIRIIDPSASEMIDSTLLPDHHKDPFDRLMIVQALRHKALFVTKDPFISKYAVETFWI
jgi:PIN domain nuclease of toxin-antitoxin system